MYTIWHYSSLTFPTTTIVLLSFFPFCVHSISLRIAAGHSVTDEWILLPLSDVVMVLERQMIGGKGWVVFWDGSVQGRIRQKMERNNSFTFTFTTYLPPHTASSIRVAVEPDDQTMKPMMELITGGTEENIPSGDPAGKVEALDGGTFRKRRGNTGTA